jgi:hypothetical protein
MGKHDKVGLGIIILSALIPTLSILLPINLWMQIWTEICLLPVAYLGYLFIGIVALVGIGYFYVDSAKVKINFAFVGLFAGIAAIIILFVPNWFYMVFFASITLELVLRKCDVLNE